MRKARKVIGYVCDIPIEGADMVISKEDQRLRLLKYAQKENLEVICVHEDEKFTADFTNRPGIKKILGTRDFFDGVLVERVWCLSRRMKDIEPFLAELEKRGLQLVTSSYLWDCVSQQVRHRYSANLAEKGKRDIEAKVRQKNARDAA